MALKRKAQSKAKPQAAEKKPEEKKETIKTAVATQIAAGAEMVKVIGHVNCCFHDGTQLIIDKETEITKKQYELCEKDTRGIKFCEKVG